MKAYIHQEKNIDCWKNSKDDFSVQVFESQEL